jgi:hypothetical protein
MGTYRSKRLRAWDFAWTFISPVAGIGEESPSEAQQRLRDVLNRLSEIPLPASAIEEMGLAIEVAWRIGRESVTQ